MIATNSPTEVLLSLTMLFYLTRASVNKNCTMLLDHSKVRRERSWWGKKLEKKYAAKSLPGGLYADGKKCPTLTRVKNSVEVQIRGKR